jgi:hypothetical protein
VLVQEGDSSFGQAANGAGIGGAPAGGASGAGPLTGFEHVHETSGPRRQLGAEPGPGRSHPGYRHMVTTTRMG